MGMTFYTPRDAIALVDSLPILLGRELPEHQARTLKSDYEHTALS
jgi:hypothetical protein